MSIQNEPSAVFVSEQQLDHAMAALEKLQSESDGDSLDLLRQLREKEDDKQ